MLLWRISGLRHRLTDTSHSVQSYGKQFNNWCQRQWSSSSSASKAAKSEPSVQDIKRHILEKRRSGDMFSIVADEATAGGSGVQKPVLMYSNERSGYYRRVSGINALQFAFWIFFANQGIALMVNRPKTMTADQLRQELTSDDNKRSVWQQMKILWADNATQMGLSLTAITFGMLSVSIICMYIIRSVRYAILSPSGRSVRLTTFSLIGSPNRYRNYDVPIEHLSATHSRTAGSFTPIKVKGKWLYFLVDNKNGQFLKPSLFDQTVGRFRVLK